MSSQPSLAIQVPASIPGERLDVYLKDHLPTVSRGTIQRLIGSGHIRVNGQPVKPTHPPRAGDRITVEWPEPLRPETRPQEIPIDVLHEDEFLLVVNKAPGIAVHPSAGHEEGTLVNAILHHCQGRLSGIGGVARPGIVHRLDLDTSGCLLVAKNDATHLELSRQFAEREVKKMYLALASGTIARDTGEIDAAITRHPTQRKRMTVTETGGRESRTSFRVEERFGAATLASVALHTGRTHQIRVHFQFLGNPLVGDEVYGKRQDARFRSETGLSAARQMLHAERLTFAHPATGKMVKVIAPVPMDFTGMLDRLREWKNRLS